MSEKDWEETETRMMSLGTSHVCIRNLQPGTMYKVKVMAENNVGQSEESKEVMFRTAEEKCHMKTT